jgi:hypothetical protein
VPQHDASAAERAGGVGVRGDVVSRAKPAPNKCPRKVSRGDDWHWRYEKCGRTAKANGFCGIHDPDRVKARQERKRADFNAHLASCKLRDAAPVLADALEALKHAASQLTITNQYRGDPLWQALDVAILHAHAALAKAGR